MFVLHMKSDHLTIESKYLCLYRSKQVTQNEKNFEPYDY